MEICIDCLESAKNAITGGATRLEVCSALSEGGLTPTAGLVKILKDTSRIPLFAMIRARGGDFTYTREEMDLMLYDLKVLKDLGVDGFVFGSLTRTNEVDVENCKEIISAAKPLPVTFHRAFDRVHNPFSSMETLIDLGFSRILTSGQRASAEAGLELIRELVARAGHRIVVMPGAGINTNNVRAIKERSMAKELHASAKTRRESATAGPEGKDVVFITDAHHVEMMVRQIFMSA